MKIKIPSLKASSLKTSSIKASSVICITLILLIYIVLTLLVTMKKYKIYIYENWSRYKCNPLIIPMASYYNPKTTTGENFNMCLTELQLEFFKILLAPLFAIFDIIQSTIGSILQVFNSLRSQISTIRSRVQAYVEKIIQVFEGLETSLRKFLIKLKSMIGKAEGIMILTEYTFIVISMALEWIFNVPGIIALVTIIILVILAIIICLFFPLVCAILAVLAAGVGIAYCFDEDTEIKLENGLSEKISELKIGDRLYLGGNITSIIKSKHNNDVYNYKDVIVSGEHLVFDHQQWKKVKDCHDSQKINYSKEFLYCLSTENNQIVTQNNIVFRDFDETDSSSLNCIFNNIIINYLNQSSRLEIYPRCIQSELEIMPCGFSGNTLIGTSSGKKYITDLKIGESLSNNSTIVSIIKTSSQNITMFNYHGLIVSGSNPVLEDGHWIRVYESKGAKLVDFNEKYIYHLGTDNQHILINNYNFRDYLEIPNGSLSDKIDLCIINHLNNQ